MEFLPVELLEEVALTRKLLAHHILTIGDLQTALKISGEGGLTWLKDGRKTLEEKIETLANGIKNGIENPRDIKYVDTFNSIPGSMLSLNGINLVTGKRGTGKTTFALLQIINAFLDLHYKPVLAYLEDNLSVEATDKLFNYKVLFFSFREYFDEQLMKSLILERSKRFLEKGFMAKKSLTPENTEVLKNKLAVFLMEMVCVVDSITFEDLKTILIEAGQPNKLEPSVDIFGIILDDLGIMVTRIDSISVKSDVRHLCRLCNEIIFTANIPVILTDSVRNYYEEDTYDEVKLFINPIVFCTISDILYLSKTEQQFHRVATLKSSKGLTAIESKP